MLDRICEELGITIGEEWEGNDGEFYSIEKNGKLIKYVYKEDGGEAYTDWIERVLTGELKPVWKPKAMERYYIPRMNYEMYDDWCWVNDENDNWWLENSMIFKTKEEAIECANRMLKTVREYQHEIS